MVCFFLCITFFSIIGCTTKDFYDMELVDNPKAQNVDSVTLLVFLEQDKVNENGYKLGEYDCKHFACDLHNNAEAMGIRCAIVRIPERGHICNAFETTDRGLLFVDASCGTDNVAYEYGPTVLQGGFYSLGVDGPIWVDEFPYIAEEGQLVIKGIPKQGIGEAYYILGYPEDFKIEW